MDSQVPINDYKLSSTELPEVIITKYYTATVNNNTLQH